MPKPAIPEWLATPDVQRAIRFLPGFHDATLGGWTGRPLEGGTGECLGVWRLAGDAGVDGSPRRWSMVLKGWAGHEVEGSPSTWNWPHREMELYRSGMLDDLPGGIRAPWHYGDIERADGSIWVWLEDITDGIQAPWPLDRYATIARQLGQFNGAWLVDRKPPDAAFLSRNWLRAWVELAAPAVEAFTTDADLARSARVYPAEVLDSYARLWRQRHALYNEMAHLPQTFSHMDAFSRNIFVRQRPGEPDDTILIDWSYTGIGAIGEELVPLVGASVGFLDAPVATIAEMSETALEGYIAGLRDAGWHGDTTELQSTFYAAMGLRYGIGSMRFLLQYLDEPDGNRFIEKRMGCSSEEYLANMLAFNTWVVRAIAAQDGHSRPTSPPSGR
jgi:hypothetical protein